MAFGSTLQELKVILGADVSDFEKELDAAAKAQRKFGKELQDVGKELSLKLTAPLLLAGGAAIKFAMDVQESENLYRISLGKMSAAGEEWSQGLSEALGLNEFEIRKNLGVLNQMLSSMGLGQDRAFGMAKGLTQLAYDMASFFNLRPEEAFQKLQAGISGEAEPLKRLGILIDENTIKTVAYQNGIAELGAELTQTQKVQARYLAIMQQTANAQGDLARTLDSPTNLLRVLGSQIELAAVKFGNVLLPALVPVLQLSVDLARGLNGLLDSFSKTPPFIQSTAIAILGLAAALGPLLTGAGYLLKIWPAVKALFLAGSSAVLPLVASFGLLALKVVLVAGAFAFFYANGQKVVDGLSGVFLAFLGTVLGVMETLVSKLATVARYVPGWGDEISQSLRGVAQDLRIAADAADMGAQEFADSFSKQGGWLENFKNQLSDWGLTIGQTFKQVEETAQGTNLVPPAPTQEALTAWDTWAAGLKVSVQDLATGIYGAMKGAISGITDVLVSGSGNWGGVLLNFLKQSLAATTAWALAKMTIFQNMNKALAAAISGPWGWVIIPGLIAATIAVGTSSIPALATGGMTTGTTIAKIGDNPGGKEAILPLDSPSTTNALAKAMPEGGRGEQIIQFYLDGQLVAENTARHLPGVLKVEGVFR